MLKGARLDFPATGRNSGPILEVLKDLLPVEGMVVEVASGSGQHVARFSAAFPGLVWQPTDIEPDHHRSIIAWTEGCRNVLGPVTLDAMASEWPVGRADAVLCINMIHIAPWTAGLGLFNGAGKILQLRRCRKNLINRLTSLAKVAPPISSVTCPSNTVPQAHQCGSHFARGSASEDCYYTGVSEEPKNPTHQ